MRTWINSRTSTLVGAGNPLQKGAPLRRLQGAADTCYAYLTLLPGTGAVGGAESPQMLARITASIYGPTIEAITNASMALADELVTGLNGQTVIVGDAGKQVQIFAADYIDGPSDVPDGDLPRHVVDWSIILQPYGG